MRGFTESHHDWLTVVQLPSYAPDLNPTEGVWANTKNGLGNLAASNLDQLAAIVRNRLKRIQYRAQLIDGFLAQTGLTLEPPTAVGPKCWPFKLCSASGAAATTRATKATGTPRARAVDAAGRPERFPDLPQQTRPPSAPPSGSRNR